MAQNEGDAGAGLEWWNELYPLCLLAATRLLLGLGLVSSVLLNLYVDEDDLLNDELDDLTR